METILDKPTKTGKKSDGVMFQLACAKKRQYCLLQLDASAKLRKIVKLK